MRSNYELLKRFDEYREELPIYLREFLERYEISKVTFFRDLKVLEEMYNIHYEYDKDLNAYLVK